MAESDTQFDALASLNALMARWSPADVPECLSMHKHILPPSRVGGSDPEYGSAQTIDRWLAQLVTRNRPRKVLDLGCGFGVALYFVSTLSDCETIGLNSSRYCIERANQFWRQRLQYSGIRFVHGGFCETELADDYDAILAIEALGYMENPRQTLAWIYRAMAPGGRLWVLDDWRCTTEGSNSAVTSMCHYWRKSQFWPLAAVLDTAVSIGFEVEETVDLTERVIATAKPPAPRRRVLLETAARLPGPAGELARAFAGGWFLELLYTRGHARYTLLQLKRPEPGGV
jgi:SAM-dependent methyltransferase